jgi:hypothetical protein
VRWDELPFRASKAREDSLKGYGTTPEAEGAPHGTAFFPRFAKMQLVKGIFKLDDDNK